MNDHGFQYLPGILPANPTDTQVEAVQRAAPKMGTIRYKVYEELKRGPKTDDELVALLGITPNSVRPRRVELVDAGLVEDSGQRRPSAAGSPAIVWRATEQ